MADGTSVGSRLGSSTFRCLSLSQQMPAIISGVEYPLTTGMRDYFDNVEMNGAFGSALGPCPDWMRFRLIQSMRAMAEIPPVIGHLCLPIRNDSPNQSSNAMAVSHWTASGPNSAEAIVLATSFRGVDKPEGATHPTFTSTRLPRFSFDLRPSPSLPSPLPSRPRSAPSQLRGLAYPPASFQSIQYEFISLPGDRVREVVAGGLSDWQCEPSDLPPTPRR